MTVSALSATHSAAPGPATGTKSLTPTGDFAMFLKMLTTQMQNQDPLNPIESSDYAVQLATFSGVEQQVRTNQLLQDLTKSLGAGIAQFAGWVGMEVPVEAPVRFDGTALTLDLRPQAGADQTRLVVYDSSNHELGRFEVPVASGPADWSGTDGRGGRFGPGIYGFALESLRGGQSLGTTPVAAYGRITEVRSDPAGTLLVLEGGRTVAAQTITALRRSPG